MLPLTKADSWPNIGLSVTAGSSGTSFANAAFASSLGFGIFIGPRGAGIGRHFPPTATTAAKEVYQPESKDRFWHTRGHPSVQTKRKTVHGTAHRDHRPTLSAFL